MSHHHHENHKHQHHLDNQPKPKNGLHRDWRVIVGAILMLIAILTYVLTMDESFRPMFAPAKPVPAAPANP